MYTTDKSWGELLAQLVEYQTLDRKVADSNLTRGAVLCKALLHFLVLVPARKMSPHDWKIVNLDAKPQSEQIKHLKRFFLEI